MTDHWGDRLGSRIWGVQHLRCLRERLQYQGGVSTSCGNIEVPVCNGDERPAGIAIVQETFRFSHAGSHCRVRLGKATFFLRPYWLCEIEVTRSKLWYWRAVSRSGDQCRTGKTMSSKTTDRLSLGIRLVNDQLDLRFLRCFRHHLYPTVVLCILFELTQPSHTCAHV